MIRSANYPVNIRHPGKRPINETLLIWSENLLVTLRHRGKRQINEAFVYLDVLESEEDYMTISAVPH
jgi:hypothetical protein